MRSCGVPVVNVPEPLEAVRFAGVEHHPLTAKGEGLGLSARGVPIRRTAEKARGDTVSGYTIIRVGFTPSFRFATGQRIFGR